MRFGYREAVSGLGDARPRVVDRTTRRAPPEPRHQRYCQRERSVRQGKVYTAGRPDLSWNLEHNQRLADRVQGEERETEAKPPSLSDRIGIVGHDLEQ